MFFKNKFLNKLAIICTGGIFTLVSGCSDPAPVPTTVSGKTMGTFYFVETSEPFAGGSEALQNLCEQEYSRISALISTFDKNAELYKLDDNKSTDPIEISDGLAKIIKGCLEQSERIDFAMDVTVGPLVNLWGFGKDKRLSKEPDEQAILQAQKLVGPDKFSLSTDDQGKNFITKALPEVRIDLATVGEGLGADAVAEVLNAKGVKNYLSSVAGASRSAGTNPQGKPWRIGIEDPSTPDHKVFQAVCPLGMAMSTAGSYRNYFKDEQSGRIYSHAIDPKTGRPVYHATMSVTVIAPTAFETDALDTGLLVMGADRALAWAEREGVAVYTIEMKDGKAVGRYSSAFKPYLECRK